MKYKTNLIVFIVNLFTFILFYNSDIKHVSSKMMCNIIIFQSLFYINLDYFIVLLSEEKNDLTNKFEKNFFFKEIDLKKFTLLYDILPDKIKLNTYILKISLCIVFFLEHLYCFESLNLLTHPIKSNSRQQNYKILSYILIFTSFFTILQAVDDEKKYYINEGLLGICIFTILYTLYPLILSLNKKGIIIKIDYWKKIMIIRHILYVFSICSMFLMVFLINNKNQKEHEINLDNYSIGITYRRIINWVLIILTLNRLFEIDYIHVLIVYLKIKFNIGNSYDIPEGNNDTSTSIFIEPEDSTLNDIILIENKSNINNISIINDQNAKIPNQMVSGYISEIIYNILNGLIYIEKNSSNDFVSQFESNFNILINHEINYEQNNIKIKSGKPYKKTFYTKYIKNIFSDFFSTKNILVEYAPLIFHNIRIMSKISKKVLIHSLDIEKNFPQLSELKDSDGKSGSVFFYTYDKKFIIKTIPDNELTSITNSFLKDYYDLISENNRIILCKIYGVYTFKTGLNEINFILMENIAPIDDKYIKYKFDLKGSLQGRKTKNFLIAKHNKTLKDLDYKELKKSKPITMNLPEAIAYDLEQLISEGIKILEKNNLMDYSFFLSIIKINEENKKTVLEILEGKNYYESSDGKFIYIVGVIDYLTEYDGWKSGEAFILKFIHKKNSVSAIHPTIYSSRFRNFVRNEVIKRIN